MEKQWLDEKDDLLMQLKSKPKVTLENMMTKLCVCLKGNMGGVSASTWV